MAKKPGFEDWLRAAIALFGSGASAAGGVGAMTLLSGVGGGPSVDDGSDKAESLGHNFNYDLNYIPGPAQMNHMLMQETADEYAPRQTLLEHVNALRRYVRPGMNPAQMKEALRRGKEYEQSLPQWWDDDRPRKNFTPSSSAVSGIRITPDNRIQIRFGKGSKWYSYRGGATPGDAAKEVQKLIGTNGQSIGQNLVRKSKVFGQWAREHYLPGY
jgi:hypothetical protein